MAELNGGSSENQNFQRLNRMEDVIQSMIELVQLQHQTAMAELHELRGSIQELLALQREHRIDIMALFEVNKRAKERLDKGGL